jgi:hypothetical protein
MSSLGKEHHQEPDDNCKVFASACKLSPGLNISYLKPLAFCGEFLLPPHLSQTSHIWFDMYNLFWNKNVATATYLFCSHQHKSDSLFKRVVTKTGIIFSWVTLVLTLHIFWCNFRNVSAVSFTVQKSQLMSGFTVPSNEHSDKWSKYHFWKSRHHLEINMKTSEVWCEGMDWVWLVGSCERGN